MRTQPHNARPRVTIRAMEGIIDAAQLALIDAALLGDDYVERRKRRERILRARQWAKAMREYLAARRKRGYRG